MNWFGQACEEFGNVHITGNVSSQGQTAALLGTYSKETGSSMLTAESFVTSEELEITSMSVSRLMDELWSLCTQFSVIHPLK